MLASEGLGNEIGIPYMEKGGIDLPEICHVDRLRFVTPFREIMFLMILENSIPGIYHSFAFQGRQEPAVHFLRFAVEVFSAANLTINFPNSAENLSLELFSLCLTHAALKGITTDC
jgi:hypothetical protein